MKAKRIFENPNAIIKPKEWQKYYDKKEMSYQPKPIEYDVDDDNITFGYSIDDTIVLSNNGKLHDDLRYKGNRIGRSKNSGRVFIEEKVITFWDYPKDYNQLLNVIKDIEDKSGLDILKDNEWKIEIPSGIYKNAIDSNIRGGWGDWRPKIIDVNYIPIDEYKGGYKRSAAELSSGHLGGSKSPNTLAYNKAHPRALKAWDRARMHTSESFYPILKF